MQPADSIDYPAWLQAGAGIIALGISVWAAWLANLQQDRKDNLKATGIAVAIYPELLKLKILVEDAQKELQRTVEQLGRLVGQSVGASISMLQIDMPPMIERNIDNLFLLGDPAGLSMLQLVNIIMQYNKFTADFSQRMMMMNAEQWVEATKYFGEHYELLANVVSKCEREVRPLHDAIKS